MRAAGGSCQEMEPATATLPSTRPRWGPAASACRQSSPRPAAPFPATHRRGVYGTGSGRVACPVQLRNGQFIQSFPQGCARHRDRVDAVGLPGRSAGATDAGHQLGRHPLDALSASDQKPLKGPRDVPAVLERQTRAPASPRAQTNRAVKPRAPTGTVLSPTSSPGAADTAASVCDRLWVSAPSTITRPATSDTTKGSQATTADSLKRVGSPPGRDLLHSVGRHRRREPKQQAVKAEALASLPKLACALGRAVQLAA